jgi:hypothetical protein
MINSPVTKKKKFIIIKKEKTHKINNTDIYITKVALN